MIKYQQLIRSLPFEDQLGVPNEKIWSKLLEDNGIEMNNLDFSKGFSKKDLFDMKLGPNKIVSILIWGYPTGGRGNNIDYTLKKVKTIENIIGKYEGKAIDENSLKSIIEELDKIKHLGRSTWSKILYFSNITYRNNRLLILDERINKAISDKKFCEIKFHNLRNNYPKKRADIYIEYLNKMIDLSDTLDVKPDQLEMFFFVFTGLLGL